MNTDRPGVGTSPYVVPPCHPQIKLGWTHTERNKRRIIFVDRIVIMADYPGQYKKLIECLPITPEPDKAEEQRDKEE